MASTIRIKRSGTAGAPSTLKLGELAYSHLANNGSNGGDILYIGAGTVDGNGDAPVIPIGGNFFVTQINNATDTNTASRIVRRDASGNFSAGTITAALSGNATTATTLATARTINGVSFNGGSNITITASNPNALTIGTGLSGTSYDGSGAVTIAIDSTVATLTGTQTLTNKTLTDSTTFFQDEADNTKKLQFQLSGISTATTRTLTIPNVSGTIITTGDTATVTNAMLANSSVTVGTTAINLGATSTTLAGLTSVSSTSFTGALTGNASTATTLATTRNINGVGFNGSADITITANTTNALTIGTGLSGTSFNGSSAVTIAIDSTVATLTGTQTLTNKTLTDSTTFFQDEGDNTKKLQFQLSGIATATTRTLTVPNVNGTIVTSGDTATVTNAMLANSSVTVGTTAISLGSSSTTLAGLTSVSSTSFTGALTGNASTATALATSRNFSASGDATTAAAVSFNGTQNVDLALTLATTLDGTTNKIAGTFGSAGAVPVITVDAKGRVTAITTAATSSSLSIAGTTGTDTVTVGTDTLTFAGGTGVTTAVTNNQVSFAIGQAVGTGDNVTFNNLTVSGNLLVNGTTTTVNSTTVTIDDPIFTLGGDIAPTVDDNKDRGIEFRWHNGTAAKVGFFGFDDSTGYFTFIPDATNTGEVFSGTQGDIQATNFRGALIGNASTATTLATSRNFSASGDATATAVGFNGGANVDLALTLATTLDGTTNKVAGTFGSTTAVPVITVDAKGRVTAITTNNIPTATSSVLGLASFNSTDFLVTAGAVTIATVDGGSY